VNIDKPDFDCVWLLSYVERNRFASLWSDIASRADIQNRGNISRSLWPKEITMDTSEKRRRPPGRPKGSLNKRTVLLRQAVAQLDPAAGDLRLTPKAALETNMHHWQAEADALECEIQAQLRAGVPREQLSKQRKMADDYRMLACDAAARLAPYIHPKIGEVPVKTDGATEYVIVVPPSSMHRTSGCARPPKRG
jgi:hypothetical protein